MVSILGNLVITFHQRGTITDLTQQMIAVNNNKPALDLVESAATKVIPVELATQILNYVTAAKPMISDVELRKLVDQLQEFARKVTDNKPNDPPPDTSMPPGDGAG